MKKLVAGGYKVKTGVKSGDLDLISAGIKAATCKAQNPNDNCAYVKCGINGGVPRWLYNWDDRANCLGDQRP